MTKTIEAILGKSLKRKIFIENTEHYSNLFHVSLQHLSKHYYRLLHLL